MERGVRRCPPARLPRHVAADEPHAFVREILGPLAADAEAGNGDLRLNLMLALHVLRMRGI